MRICSCLKMEEVGNCDHCEHNDGSLHFGHMQDDELRRQVIQWQKSIKRVTEILEKWQEVK